MSQNNLQQQFQNQVNDVFTRLENKQMFQSDWDIASFAIFFIFIGESVRLRIVSGTSSKTVLIAAIG
ncbi:small integral membrane protein 22 [Tachysurus ichikawai]